MTPEGGAPIITADPLCLEAAEEIKRLREPLTEAQIIQALAAAGCCGKVVLTYDSGPYEVTKATQTAIDLVRAIEHMKELAADYPCRRDGRCQYAIDHGAEDLGHCPRGKCVMPEGEPK